MPRRMTRILAGPVVCLFVTILAMPMPAHAADERHEIRGKVISYDGVTPAEGVTVSLVNSAAGKVYTSKPTDITGEYRIPKVPDGDYTIRIQHAGSTYELPNPVSIGGGQPGAITVILPEEMSDEQAGEPGEKRRRRKAAWIAFPVAGGILLAAILLGDSESDEDDDASPKKP